MSIAEKLTTIAENEPRVFEAGKKSQYDLFWDGLQVNGTRNLYPNTFCHWTDEMFYPKYDIIYGSQSSGLFWYSKIKNIKKRLEECGVTIHWNHTSLQSCFNECTTEEIPILDFSGLSSNSSVSMQYTFYHATNLKKVHIKNAKLAYFQYPFYSCKALEEIVLENVVFMAISVNGLSLSASTKLTKDSLLAVLNALEQTTSSPKITLGATNLAKLTDAEKAIATDKGWTLA